jgi:DNA helicase-2/ATP-dependent DNA helicase PcrA
MGIKDSDIQILDAIGFNEPTPLRLIERLDELLNILKGKEFNPECPFILSTIKASKDIEYDTVYIMDAKDGILPENVIKDTKKATSEELKIFEDERKLYHVAVSRAKNHLNIFSFKYNSIFTDELLGKSNKPIIKSHARKNILLSKSAQSQVTVKKTVVESEYLDLRRRKGDCF